MKSRDKIITWVVLALGVFLRFYRLSGKSFWCDEFLAISLGRMGLREMAGWVLVNDAHPPVFYSIFHFILRFTSSEAGLRFLPAVFGAGAMLMFWLLLKRFAPRKNAFLLPLALFALSPAAILWSRIVKPYSFITFFSLLSVYSFLSLGETRRLRHGLCWLLSTVILVYLHNYGAIIFAAQAITLLLRRKSMPVKSFVLPACGILLAYLPYLAGPIFSQLAFAKGAVHTVTNPFLRIAYAFYYFVFGETLSPLNLMIVIPGGAAFFFFFVMGLFRREENLLKTFSLAAFIIAAALFFGVASTIPQNLVHLQPFFYVTVVSGIYSARQARVRFMSGALLLFFLLPSVYFYYRGESLQYHDVSKLIPYREISRMIEARGKEGEAVIFTEPRERRFSSFFEPYSPWDWYYKGSLPVFEVSPSTRDSGSEMADIAGKHDGFWLLLNYGFVEPSWNRVVLDFFSKGKSVKIKEMKFVPNVSFLDVLKGKSRGRYYFLEVYHISKDG